MNSYKKTKAALMVLLLLCGFLISNMFAFRFRIALFQGIEQADIFAIIGVFLLLSSEELFPFLTPNYLLDIISCDLMFLIETFISLQATNFTLCYFNRFSGFSFGARPFWTPLG